MATLAIFEFLVAGNGFLAIYRAGAGAGNRVPPVDPYRPGAARGTHTAGALDFPHPADCVGIFILYT